MHPTPRICTNPCRSFFRIAFALFAALLTVAAYGQTDAAAREPVFWTEPTLPDDQRQPPAAADPTDRAADTFQADPRLATCQPTHTSLPEKILETLAT